jgi:hypothetical protein
MYKLLTFSGYDTNGPHIFPIEPDLDRTIGHIKMARPLPSEIEQYIRTAKPVAGKTQLLIDAMGAGEYYGSNVNGDYFPEEALRHDGPDYGHKTFQLYAYPFKHHINKDPARAYGEKVTLASYDPYMHRVLLIVSVDDSKCQDILGDLANNRYWDVSMGCRVPWDECSICRNRAKNRGEYCPHLRYQMNKILQDGRRVFAYNRLPKFFDISFVTIGAEKASHVLKKVAFEGRMLEIVTPSAELGEAFYEKLAAQEKGAVQRKEADIDKDVPSQPAANVTGVTPEDKSKLLSFMDAAGDVKTREAPLPSSVLDRLSDFPLGSIFSTLTALGIGLRPQEFQRIVLVKEGARALADKLAAHRLVFDEAKPATTIPKWASKMGSFSATSINEKVAMIVAPYLKERSCYPEILCDRLLRMEKSSGEMIYQRDTPWYPMTDEQKRQTSGVPGLIPASMALAAGFLVFRSAFPELMAKAPLSIQSLAKHPWLLPLLLGAGVATSVGVSNMTAPMPLTNHGTGGGLDAKNTPAYHEPKVASVARLGLIPLAYMYSGIQQKRWQRGERLNALDRMIALRPELFAIGSFAAGPSVAKGIKNLAGGLMKSGSESIEDTIINTTQRLASR